jgi:hypothetical protein
MPLLENFSSNNEYPIKTIMTVHIFFGVLQSWIEEVKGSEGKKKGEKR